MRAHTNLYAKSDLDHIRSVFDDEHIRVPLHLIGKGLIVSDADDPKVSILQL